MRRAAGLLLLALAASASAAGGDRFVLAWPPSRYASAELAIWRDTASTETLRVRVLARGLDAVLDVPASLPLRVPLPASAQCAAGLDACAIEVTRQAGTADFSVALQSPGTDGVADTLLMTAHDTVRVPPAGAAVMRHVALSWPCAPSSELPMTASFVTVVPVSRQARVRAAARACLPATDALVPFGSALTLACGATDDDVTGLALDADAPVVALSGNAVTSVPVDPGAGLSGDLVLDLAATSDGPARYAVPPLPRAAAHSGRGDVVRIVAVEDTRVAVADGEGGSRAIVLRAGEHADVDTLGAGADVALSLVSDGSIAAWHLPKSRALRGVGDPAAIPLVPSTRFTLRDRFFVPDGYAEANALCIAAEPGARITLDGAPVSLSPAPGGALDMARVDLPPAAAGGAVHELRGDRPFGAWVASFGGYKACGHAAAIAWPSAPWLLRGTVATGLAPFVAVTGRAHSDAAPEPLVYWRLDDDAPILMVARCGGACCLAW